MRQRVVPEIALSDIRAAADLVGTFPEAVCREVGPDLHCTIGDQALLLRRGDPVPGPIHHIAIAVGDADLSLEEGAILDGVLDAEMTPDGVASIPEFWEGGVRYVFLRGPENVRFELCSGRRTDVPGGIGHDHIAVLCEDLAEMRAFFMGFGLRELASHVLHREDGDTQVSFLAHGEQVIELFRPPSPSSVPGYGSGRIVALQLEGTGRTGEATGPEGIKVILKP